MGTFFFKRVWNEKCKESMSYRCCQNHVFVDPVTDNKKNIIIDNKQNGIKSCQRTQCHNTFRRELLDIEKGGHKDEDNESLNHI